MHAFRCHKRETLVEIEAHLMPKNAARSHSGAVRFLLAGVHHVSDLLFVRSFDCQGHGGHRIHAPPGDGKEPPLPAANARPIPADCLGTWFDGGVDIFGSVADASVRPAAATDSGAMGEAQLRSWRATFADKFSAEAFTQIDADAFASSWRNAITRPPSEIGRAHV